MVTILIARRRGPLRVVASAGLAGAGGGGAERGEVAGGARRAQPRQHGGLVGLRRGGRRLARPAQRARRCPHREHEGQHGAAIVPRARLACARPRPTNTPVKPSVQVHNVTHQCESVVHSARSRPSLVSECHVWPAAAVQRARLTRALDHYCTRLVDSLPPQSDHINSLAAGILHRHIESNKSPPAFFVN